jgi:hypothetical protein
MDIQYLVEVHNSTAIPKTVLFLGTRIQEYVLLLAIHGDE